MRPDDAQHALKGPADDLLSFAKCFGAIERNVTYVSVPITTGHRYLQWRITRPLERVDAELEASHRQDVIAHNVAAATDLVRHVRDRFDGIVIDPTQLDDVDQWEQANYHGFWSALIERFVGTIVFADGWQYSTGCSIELATACRNDITILDHRLSPLAPEKAVQLL